MDHTLQNIKGRLSNSRNLIFRYVLIYNREVSLSRKIAVALSIVQIQHYWHELCSRGGYFSSLVLKDAHKTNSSRAVGTEFSNPIYRHHIDKIDFIAPNPSSSLATTKLKPDF